MKITTNIGTQLKLLLVPQCGELTGADFDFKARFFTFLGSVSVTVSKADMTATDDGGFYAIVDTKFFTPGELTASVTALIPDDDAPGGYRREVSTLKTGIELRRAAL